MGAVIVLRFDRSPKCQICCLVWNFGRFCDFVDFFKSQIGGQTKSDKSYFGKFTDGQKLFREILDGRIKNLPVKSTGTLVKSTEFGKIDRIW